MKRFDTNISAEGMHHVLYKSSTKIINQIEKTIVIQ